MRTMYGAVSLIQYLRCPIVESQSTIQVSCLPALPASIFPSYSEDEKPELVQRVRYKGIGRGKKEAGKAGKKGTWMGDCDSTIGHLKYWISETAPYIVRMDFTDKESRLWTLTKV